MDDLINLYRVNMVYDLDFWDKNFIIFSFVNGMGLKFELSFDSLDKFLNFKEKINNSYQLKLYDLIDIYKKINKEEAKNVI
jgi:hypothetical protein